MSGELKACPFCGSREVFAMVGPGGAHAVCCAGGLGCDTRGPAFKAIEDALKYWNARAPDQSAELVSELVERLAEWDRLSLVVESAVRNADAPNRPLVLAAIMETRATLAKAKAGGA